jgi:hypothetical protein
VGLRARQDRRDLECDRRGGAEAGVEIRTETRSRASHQERAGVRRRARNGDELSADLVLSVSTRT